MSGDEIREQALGVLERARLDLPEVVAEMESDYEERDPADYDGFVRRWWMHPDVARAVVDAA